MRMRLGCAALLCLTSAACSGRGGERADTTRGAPPPAVARSSGGRATLPHDAAAALDDANAAFRAGRYDAALRGYRTAAERAPTNAAPYYGIYMVARQLRDSALADSAMVALRARTPVGATLSDSAMAAAHAGAGGAGALPPGHPSLAPRALPPGHPIVRDTAKPRTRT